MIGLSERGKQRNMNIVAVTKKISTFIRCESDGTTVEASVMEVEEQPLVTTRIPNNNESDGDGKPCDGKLSCMVWAGGKSGDNTKGLPIGIT